MKKIALVLVFITTLISCGSDKKKEAENNEGVTDKPKNAFIVEVEGIYEKDDSIAVYHKVNDYYQYDKPTTIRVKGSPMPQKLFFNLPVGLFVQNLTFVASTNKDQDHITIKGISLKNGSSVVYNGSNFKFVDCFLTDTSFSWDTKNSRYSLNHSNKYPPSFVGNDNLEGILTK